MLDSEPAICAFTALVRFNIGRQVRTDSNPQRGSKHRQFRPSITDAPSLARRGRIDRITLHPRPLRETSTCPDPENDIP